MFLHHVVNEQVAYCSSALKLRLLTLDVDGLAHLELGAWRSLERFSGVIMEVWAFDRIGSYVRAWILDLELYYDGVAALFMLNRVNFSPFLSTI